MPRKWVEVKDSGLLPNLKLFDGVKPNTYELQGGMVVLITGKKGDGKTQLIAHLAGTQMLPPVSFEKVRQARWEAALLRARGFKRAVIPPDVKHLVYSPKDEIIRTCKDQGYLPRESYVVDIKRMKLPTEKDRNVQFFPHGATIAIDELMSKFDARNFNNKELKMPQELINFLEYCRHYGICLITGTLVATGIDKRFREMSNNILQIVRREDHFKDEKLVKVVWYCLEFNHADICDKFLRNPGTVHGTPRVFVHHGNMRACVDSFSKKDDFVEGLEDKPIEFTRRESA